MPLTDNEIRQHINDGLTDQDIVDLYASDYRMYQNIQPDVLRKALRDNEWVYKDLVTNDFAGTLHAHIEATNNPSLTKKYSLLLDRIADGVTIETATNQAVASGVRDIVISFSNSTFTSTIGLLTGGFRYTDVNLAYVTARRAEYLTEQSDRDYLRTQAQKASQALDLFETAVRAAVAGGTQWDATELANQWATAWSNA